MNSRFASFQKQQQNRQNSPMDFQMALQNLANQIAPTGMTAEQIVRQKIQNGQMTQAQFEKLSQMANSAMSFFTGRR